jgi:preprotein translocase subunit SecE
MSNFITYAKESYKELAEKVTWPTWPQLQQSTMIVLAATIVITLLVWGMDFASKNILTQAYKFLFPTKG